MINHSKGRAKIIFVWVLTNLFAQAFCYSGVIHANVFSINEHACADTIPVKFKGTKALSDVGIPQPVTNTFQTVIKDTLKKLTDSLEIQSDTINVKKSKDSISAPIHYYANDSIVFDLKANTIVMYGKKSNLKYADNELFAPNIKYHQSSNILSAHLEKDSLGNVIAFPTFTQAGFKTVSDSITFNMKSGRGITKGSYTQQGELFIHGDKIKKTSADVFYAQRGKFTTCNLDTPHFAFVSEKVKFVNQKFAFTGPVHPEFEGVPVPIVLPFGIYPLNTGVHSGLLSPSVTANDQLGISLEGLGYYKTINQYWDIVVLGTLYSYGSWTMNLSPRYNKRYRYRGNLSFDIQQFKNAFKGDPDYSASKTYNIRWSHSADSKARPGVSFAANVNAGSSKFNAQVPNSPMRNFTNQLNSSITYSKVWKNKPYNLSLSANHNQNTLQRLINVNLPDVAFNVNTQYPFRRKEVIGNYKWYENIGIALNSNARSLTSFYDTATGIGKQIQDNFKWGAAHSVPITLSLPPLAFLQVSPSVSYQEKWYQEKFSRKWNGDQKKIDTVINNGLYSAREMSFGLGMSTRIFGMFSFNKNSRIQAIRHEIRPSISANYRPNMNKLSYYNTQTDTSGNQQKFSYYERSVFGVFSDSRFGGVNFGLDNILQMKVKAKNDTASTSLKKISLIDGLGLNGNFNFLADSFKMSNLSLTFRNNLFEKLNITANAQFDPYLRNSSGSRINRLVWTNHPISLGTLTGAAISLQSRFSGGDKSTMISKQNTNSMPGKSSSNQSADESQSELNDVQNNANQFVDFSVPWDIDFSYSLRISKVFSPVYSKGYRTNISQDVNWNGHIRLTPQWNIGLTGSYNISLKELGLLSLNLSRELHCWQMNISISPVGRYRFFTINISPKSSLLRDIKINRTRYFYDL